MSHALAAVTAKFSDDPLANISYSLPPQLIDGLLQNKACATKYCQNANPIQYHLLANHARLGQPVRELEMTLYNRLKIAYDARYCVFVRLDQSIQKTASEEFKRIWLQAMQCNLEQDAKELVKDEFALALAKCRAQLHTNRIDTIPQCLKNAAQDSNALYLDTILNHAFCRILAENGRYYGNSFNAVYEQCRLFPNRCQYRQTTNVLGARRYCGKRLADEEADRLGIASKRSRYTRCSIS